MDYLILLPQLTAVTLISSRWTTRGVHRISRYLWEQWASLPNHSYEEICSQDYLDSLIQVFNWDLKNKSPMSNLSQYMPVVLWIQDKPVSFKMLEIMLKVWALKQLFEHVMITSYGKHGNDVKSTKHYASGYINIWNLVKTHLICQVCIMDMSALENITHALLNKFRAKLNNYIRQSSIII